MEDDSEKINNYLKKRGKKLLPRKIVDLPAPFGPVSKVVDFLGKVKEISCRISVFSVRAQKSHSSKFISLLYQRWFDETKNLLQNSISMKNQDEAKIQAERTSEWDRHDSTDLIEERSENWLNDERFLDYEDDDETVFGRGDDYFERNQGNAELEEDAEIEDFPE